MASRRRLPPRKRVAERRPTTRFCFRRRRDWPDVVGRHPGVVGRREVGANTIFANFFENISSPADFRIREYSREYRCPCRLFLKNIELFFSPLTVVDFNSQDIRKYSRRYNRGVYNLLARASQNSALALNSRFWVDSG